MNPDFGVFNSKFKTMVHLGKMGRFEFPVNYSRTISRSPDST